MPVLSNPKHERFAQELAKGKPASVAYVLAGYKANDGNAATLKGNQRVLERVDELVNAVAEKAGVTIQSLSEELEEARAVSKANGQGAAMVSATMGKAKLFGFLKEKTNEPTPPQDIRIEIYDVGNGSQD